MRKILSLLLCSALVFLASCDQYLLTGYPEEERGEEDSSSTDISGGEDVSEDALKSWGKFTYYTVDDGAYIYAYTGNAEEPEVPADFDGLPLLGIHAGAFAQRGAMATLVLPDTVTEIGDGAFRGCGALTEVSFGALERLGESAFEDCGSLTAVTGTAKRIGGGAFRACASLTAIDLAATVQVGEEAFLDCASLTEADTSALTFIGKRAFAGCGSLTELTLNEKLLRIPDGAFKDCAALTKVNGLNAQEIQQDAFFGCSSLASVTLPDTLTVLGRSAFQGCASLTEIAIPSGIDAIEPRVFDGCESLVTVDLPDSVKSVGDSAFGGCTALKDITLIYLKSIGLSAFQDCSSLEKAEFSSYLRTIEKNAFSGCAALKNVILPEGLTVLGDGVFKGCVSLEYMVLPASVERIPGYIFYGCTSLKKVVTLFPEMRSVGVKAFSGCISLNKIVLPETIKFVEQNAFEGCTNLFGVNIPDTAIIFGEYILGEESQAIIGFNWDKEMAAKVDAGGTVELDQYTNREDGHMVFFFEYRDDYHIVEYDLWNTVRRTLPEECPKCESTRICPTGKTVYQLMYEVSGADTPVKTKWLCQDENCGEAFDFDLDKTVTEPTPEEAAAVLIERIRLARLEEAAK